MRRSRGFAAGAEYVLHGGHATRADTSPLHLFSCHGHAVGPQPVPTYATNEQRSQCNVKVAGRRLRPYRAADAQAGKGVCPLPCSSVSVASPPLTSASPRPAPPTVFVVPFSGCQPIRSVPRSGGVVKPFMRRSRAFIVGAACLAASHVAPTVLCSGCAS